MKKREKKEAKGDIKVEYKQGKPIKDLIPTKMFPNLVTQNPMLLPQDRLPVPNPDRNRTISSSNVPIAPLEEWPQKPDSEINYEIFGDPDDDTVENSVFFDPESNDLENSLPLYLINLTDNLIQWERPINYIKDYYLDKSIRQKYPKKNYILMREDIKSNYREREKRIKKIVDEHNRMNEADGNGDKEGGENNDDAANNPPLTMEEIEEQLKEYIKNEDENVKLALYKDFFYILSTDYEIKVVDYETREETEEEFLLRKDQEEKEKKSKKSKKDQKSPEKKNQKESSKLDKKKRNPLKPQDATLDITEDDENARQKIKTFKQSNLSLTDFLSTQLMQNSFNSWITSILQMIIDLNILDCNTNKNIIYNIYPQKDGLPIYNPKGKYIIKLYQMGKPRKVVIDDRIPLNKDKEYFLPKCNQIEEIWPALFVKALLKLNMYKTKHPRYFKYEELNDVSIIYALTGMHIVTLDVNRDIINLFKNDFTIKEEGKKLSDEEIMSLKEKQKDEISNNNKENNNNAKESKKKKGKKEQNEKIKEENEDENNANDDYFLQNPNALKTFYALYNKRSPLLMDYDPEITYHEVVEGLDKKLMRRGKYIYNIDLDKTKIETIEEKNEKNNKNIFRERIRQRSSSIKISEEDLAKISKMVESSGKGKDASILNINNQNINVNNNQNNNLNNNNLSNVNPNATKNTGNFAVPKNKTKSKRLSSSKSIQKQKVQNIKKKEPIASEENNILYNYLYSVDDFFTNNNFNMKRLKFVDFSDLEKVLISKKVQFKQLALNEKKQYITSRRELKKQQLDIRNKRLDKLRENGDPCNVIKIINDATDIPKLNFPTEYTERDINMAKKCLLNHWEYPPVDYFRKDFADKERERMEKNGTKKKKKRKSLVNISNPAINKSVVSDKEDINAVNSNALNANKDGLNSNSPLIDGNTLNENALKDEDAITKQAKIKHGLFDWTEDLYINFIGGDDIYKQKSIEPHISIKCGNWLDYDKILSIFNKMIIIINQKVLFHNKIYADNSWSYFQTDIFEPLEEYNCFILTSKESGNSIQQDSKDSPKENSKVSSNRELPKSNKKRNKDKNKSDRSDNLDLSKDKSKDNISIQKLRTTENDSIKNNDDVQEKNTSSLLIIFEPYNEKIRNKENGKVVSYPYLSLDLLEREENIYRVLKSDIILNNFYSIFSYSELDKKKEYAVKVNGGNFPNGYILQVMSQNHQITNLSYDNYLKDDCGFYEFNFSIPHGIIEKNKYYLLTRITIEPSQGEFDDITNDKIMIKLNINYPLKFIKKYIHVFLVNNDSNAKKEVEVNEIINLNKNDFLSESSLENSNNPNKLNDDKDKEKEKFTDNDVYKNADNASNSVTNLNNEEPNSNSIGNNDENMESVKKGEISPSANNNKKYNNFYLVISVKSEYSLVENEFTLDILTNEKGLKFEQIEQTEPFEISEKYLPAKEGIMFAYYIYALDNLTCSLDINIYKILEEIKVEGGAKNKKAGKDNDTFNYIDSKPLDVKNNHLFLELYHLTKEPGLEFSKDALKFSYSNQGNLIKKWDFYDQISISHLNLKGYSFGARDDPKKKKVTGAPVNQEKEDLSNLNLYPYLLLCYFDTQVVPLDILLNKANDIGFTIRVFSSESIGFVKDTSKHDHEQLLIEEWENKDTGRSLRANKSRKKFMIIKKKEEQKDLNEEEIKIIEEERERRTASQIDHLVDNDVDKNKKAPASKVDNKNDKNKNKAKPNQQENDFSQIGGRNIYNFLLTRKSMTMKNIFETPLPSITDSKSTYIANYVTYANKERTVTRQTRNNKMSVDLVNTFYREKMKNTILTSIDESKNILGSNVIMIKQNEENKNDLTDMLKKMNNKFITVRSDKRKNYNMLFDIRNNFKDDYFKKDLVTKEMTEIMNSAVDLKVFDFNKMASLYKEGIKELGEKNIIVTKFFKFVSGAKEDFLKGEIKKLSTSKDKSGAVKLLEDINYNKWIVSNDTINSLKSMIK